VILKMSKVQVLGPRRLLTEALQCLHAQGVLQLRSFPDAPGEPADEKGPAKVRRVPLAGSEIANERSLEEMAGRLHELLLILPSAKGVPWETDGLPDAASAEFPSRLETVESEIRALNDKRLALQEERDIVGRYERLLTALRPLLPALEGATHVETVGILIRRDRPEALGLIEQEVTRITQGAYNMLFREVDKEEAGVLLTVPKESAHELSRLLFEQGITEIRLPERYADQPLIATLGFLLRRSREIPDEVAATEVGLRRSSARWHEPLRRAHRAVQDRLARLRALAYCGETDHAFVISGWVPSERCGALASVLEEGFQGRVTLLEHRIPENEYNAVPVVLRNPGLVRPFELLLSLLSPPRYGSIDPTPFLAGFFPLFFGLMLGDVGYGLVAFALAILARAKGWGGNTGRSVTAIVLVSSVSAIVFGVLFGEFFGGLVGARIGLHPILFDRAEAVLGFLGLVLGLGVIHVVLGIVLGLWTAIRHGDRHRALAKASTLAVILAALVAVLARLDRVPQAVGTGALVTLGPLFVVLIATEGVLAPIEIMKTMGNIFSYARLMALGIASVMLAQVANEMAGFFTVVVGVTVAVLLHTVNFAMGCFSPAIQALRLHYVEFFDKFYQDGGRPYEPFSLKS
jgi:V/A-type H+/Na+-transporting ATPase subunit I